MHAALLAWYAEHRRDLPWRDRGDVDRDAGDRDAGRIAEAGSRSGPSPRRSPDPYAVWVSEIMLQQTRVETVRPYFERWMSRLPDVAALASAPLEEVLGLWQGLGYYSRARNLHRAAREVMAAGGALPATRDGWLALPGVGEYTAGAVASIAFGEPVAAVDGNVRRVMARLFAIDADPRRAAFRRAVDEHATRLAADVPAIGAAPGDWTQALMELGATVCLPRAPRCADCPLAQWCAALAADRVAELPRPTRRAKPREARVWALVVERASDGRLLVARRPPEGLLGGLWEFVLVPWGEGDGPALVDPVAIARDSLDVGLSAIGEAALLPTVEHVFTHLRLRVGPMRVVLAEDGAGSAFDAEDPGDSVTGTGSIGTGSAADRPFHLRTGGLDPKAARRAGLPSAYAEWQWVERPAIDELPTSVLMDKLLATYDSLRSST